LWVVPAVWLEVVFGTTLSNHLCMRAAVCFLRVTGWVGWVCLGVACVKALGRNASVLLGRKYSWEKYFHTLQQERASRDRPWGRTWMPLRGYVPEDSLSGRPLCGYPRLGAGECSAKTGMNSSNRRKRKHVNS